jgi:hypothetical protein
MSEDLEGHIQNCTRLIVGWVTDSKCDFPAESTQSDCSLEMALRSDTELDMRALLPLCDVLTAWRARRLPPSGEPQANLVAPYNDAVIVSMISKRSDCSTS